MLKLRMASLIPIISRFSNLNRVSRQLSMSYDQRSDVVNPMKEISTLRTLFIISTAFALYEGRSLAGEAHFVVRILGFVGVDQRCIYFRVEIDSARIS